MITADLVKKWILRLAEVYAAEKAYLTELDSPIGDADHGINLDRGFSAVVVEFEKSNPETISEMLKLTAMTLIRTVGGASGPLYGTWFLKASIAASNYEKLDAAHFVKVVEAAVEGVAQRGKAALNDKTMLDVWIPVVERIKEKLDDGENIQALLLEAEEVAAERLKATIPMIARKGRASFLGERSIGHQDPGATSSFFLIRTAREIFE
ncbi:MAG: dihydroxyacetone kinase subunit L [Spirochaetales bacterium]|nr:MAG: dihydroxyacetone kinase subunit L [Spirochaetales bacterium]